MTVETEISTPVETTEEVTSNTVEPETDSVTSTQEPSTEEIPAETETKEVQTVEQPKLYAGKYKSIEDFEKGHNELYGAFNKAKEYENKYNQLLKEQETRAEQIAQERLRQAQQSGYRTAEEQEIDSQIKLAEYQYYAQGLNNVVSPEYLQEVTKLLSDYYSTGHKAYLDEAKRYFTSDYIEQVASAKSMIQQRLSSEIQAKKRAQFEQEQARIDEVINTQYAEFLADSKENTAKADMLKALRGIGGITSNQDMDVFIEYYNRMAQYERAMALKELEAQKVIEEAKNKAVIGSGSQATGEIGGLKESYTQAEVDAMPQAEFDTLYGKHKDKFLQRIK
jgi:hypothetical protein